MEFTNDHGKITISCNSMSDFVAYCEQTPSDAYSRIKTPSYFDANTNLNRAIELARIGCPEYAQKLADAVKVISETSNARIKAAKRDFYGESVDVGRALTSDPLCFRRRRKTNCGKHVDVYVNIAQSCTKSAESIINRGAAIVSLIDSISADCDVDIYAVMRTEILRQRKDITVKVKLSSKPLDLDGIAFALAHPAMLRRLFFAACEVALKVSNLSGDHYGSPREVDAENALVFPAAVGLYDDPTAAMNSVKGYAKNHGIIFED